jgi:hypothetical protein
MKKGEVEIHSKPESYGTVYSTVWKNGEVDVMDKELFFETIDLTNNANRTLSDYDEGFCGLRFTFTYHCDPYDLSLSDDKWMVSWTLVEEEWEDISDKAYAFIDKQLEVTA